MHQKNRLLGNNLNFDTGMYLETHTHYFIGILLWWKVPF
jgi:hypothetical protein